MPFVKVLPAERPARRTMGKLQQLFVLLLAGLFIHSGLQVQTYEIFAIKFGERTNKVSLSKEAIGDTSGDSTRVYFMYWLLKNESRIILVDAGFTSDMSIDSTKIKFTRPDLLLAGINILPAQITDIILTHPHWDHMGGIDLFPRAMVWMQEADYLDLRSKKNDPESSGYNTLDLEKILRRKEQGKLRIIKGPTQHLLPGINVYTGSCHTPGSQFVSVNNGRQIVVLASDNCKYYRNSLGNYASPSTSNPTAFLRNLRMMRDLCSGHADFIIPGHDPLVFEKFRLVAKDIVKIF